MKKVLLVALFVIMVVGLMADVFKADISVESNCTLIIKLVNTETGDNVYYRKYFSVVAGDEYGATANITYPYPDPEPGDYKWVVIAYDQLDCDTQERIAQNYNSNHVVSNFVMELDPTGNPGNPTN